MKRKRICKERKPKMPLTKKMVQKDSALVAENDVMNDKAEPGTSMSRLPISKSVSERRTEENITSLQMETDTRTPRIGSIMRGSQADLEREKSGYGRMESYPNALGQMIATIIKEISKETGDLANFSRSLIDNPISNGQMGQSYVGMNLEENESRLHQNSEYIQQELNAALTVIKKTMKLDAADPFNRPVDPVALEIPDYFDVIDTPMDFGTICNNLENGLKYKNSTDVFKDVQYIWHNCLKYNKKGDYILELMKRVKAFFMKYWKAAGLQSEQSPDIVESSISRRNKQDKDCPLAPLANVASLRQKEAGSNQVAEYQPRTSNMLAIQPEQSSSQPQSSPQEDEPNIESAIVQKKRHVRGPTRAAKLLNTVGRITIATNELGQPVGAEATKLISFLGLTARDGNLAPLTYPSWSKMPKENKEDMWQRVLAKFDIDPSCRSWVLTSLKTKWRTFKSYLKVNRYDTHATDEERLADRDERVLPDQWSALVSQWSSEKWQNISARNKANRAKLRFIHTAGQKSFARILEEEKAKRPDGQEPSRAELFIMTRTRKNGQPVNEETAAVISQLRECTTQNGETSINNNKHKDDAYNRIMGLDKKASAYLQHGSTRSEALRMVSEKNAEVLEMKERLASVEQTCSQMAAQMSQLVSMMVTMQKASPGEIVPNAVVGNLVPGDMPFQSEPASTSNHEVPAKKTRGRKKRS